MTDRIQHGSLQVAKEIDELLTEEILPGLNVSQDEFWFSFNEIVEVFVPRNNSLFLPTRLQPLRDYSLQMI